MRTTILILVALGLLVTAPARAQTPVEPIDLVMVALDYAFPTDTTIEFQADLILYKTGTSPSIFDTEVEFRLDGLVVATSSLHVEAEPNDICGADPSCSVVCDIVIDGAQSYTVHCQQWNTWYGPSCDPSDPSGTCLPMTICACHSPFTVVTTANYDGEAQLTATVDPSSVVHEADETNNTLAMQPVPNGQDSWGAVKSLYR